MAIFNDLRRASRSPQPNRRELDQGYLEQAQKEAEDKARQDAQDLKAAARAQAAEQRQAEREREREERDAERQKASIEAKIVSDRKSEGWAFETDPVTGKEKPLKVPGDDTAGQLRKLQGENLFETETGKPLAYDPVKKAYADARETAKPEFKEGRAVAKIGGKEYDVSDRPEHAERLKNQTALDIEAKKAVAATQALRDEEAVKAQAYNYAKEKRDAAKLKLEDPEVLGDAAKFEAANAEYLAAQKEAADALAASKPDPVAARQAKMKETMVETLKADEKQGKLSVDWEDYLAPTDQAAPAPITPESLQATDDRIKASSADLSAKTEALNAQVQPLVDQITAFDAQKQALAQQNAQVLATTPKDQIITLDDGSTWNKAVFEQYKALNEQQKQTEAVHDSLIAQLRPSLEAVEQYRSALEAEASAHGANVATHNARAKADRDAAIGRLRQNPATAQFADQIDALSAETEANRLALSELPDGQREAAIAAMEEVQAKKREEIANAVSGAVKADVDTQRQKQAAGAKLYQEMKNVPGGWINQETLDKLGLTREEGNKLVEINRASDFTQGNKSDKARVIQDGTIAINPTIWADQDASAAAINATDATPEQKKAALAQLPALAEQANKATLSALMGERIEDFMKETGIRAFMGIAPATAAWETLKKVAPDIGGTDIREFAKAHGADALLDTTGRVIEPSELTRSDFKNVTQLIEAWKKENGTAAQYLKQFQIGIAQGLTNIGQQAAGLLGAVGNDEAMKLSTTANDINQAFGGASQAIPGGQWVATGTSTAVNLAPTVLGGAGVGLLGRALATARLAKGAVTGAEAAALAGKFGMAGSAGAGGLQTFASTFGSAYDANKKKGMSDAEALKASYIPAFTDGLITALVTHGTPKVLAGISPKLFGDGAQGVESLAMSVAQKGLVDKVQRTVKDYVKAFTTGAASEFSEEFIQQIASDVIARASYEPDKTWSEIISNAIESGKWGAIFGGTIETVTKAGSAAQAPAPVQPAPVAPSEALKAGELAASDAELASSQDPLATKAAVLREIAQGADVSTMPEAKLNTVGLAHKGDKVAPMTGKDATGNPIVPAVQVDAEGNAIILQPAIDELAAAFPTTAKLVSMNEQEIREMLKSRKEGPPTGQGSGGSTPPVEVSPEQAPVAPAPVQEATTAPAQPAVTPPDNSTQKTEEPATESRWEITDAAGDVVMSIPKTRAKSGKEAFSIFTQMNDAGIPLTRANVRLSAAKVQERAVSEPVETKKPQEVAPDEPQAQAVQEQEKSAGGAGVTTAATESVETATPRPSDPIRDWASKNPTKAKQAEIIAAAVDKVGEMFEGVRIVEKSGGAGIRYDVATKAVEVDPETLTEFLSLSKSPKQAEQAMTAMANEELDHHITNLLLESSPEFKAALDELWKVLPRSVKLASSQAYQKNTEGYTMNPFNGKFEFVRQYRQVASFQTLTEAALREAGLIGKLKTFIAQYIRALRKIVKGKLHPEVKAKMDVILAAMEAKAKELQSIKETPAKQGAETVAPVAAVSESNKTPEIEPEAEPVKETAEKFNEEQTRLITKAEKTEALAARMKTKGQRDKLNEQASSLRKKAAAITTPVDEAAHEAATSPLNDTPEPTQAQKESGNYRMGHTNIAGLDISVENPAGSERKGVDKTGKPWSIKMQDHYGYIKGTMGRDKDHLDIFIKEGTPADYTGPVFVVNQNVNGKFDETKSVIGVATAEEARALYDRNYSKGWQGFDSIATFPTVDAYKEWLNGDHSGKAPADVAPLSKKEQNQQARAKKQKPTKSNEPTIPDATGQPADSVQDAQNVEQTDQERQEIQGEVRAEGDEKGNVADEVAPAETTVTQTTPETPSKAADKVVTELERVVDTDGATSAGEVHRRVLAALEEELVDAQVAAGFKEVEYVQRPKKYGDFMRVDGIPVANIQYDTIKFTGDKVNLSIIHLAQGLTPSEKSKAAKLAVGAALGKAAKSGSLKLQIPGDGTFTIARNPEAIRATIARIKSGGPTPWKDVVGKKYTPKEATPTPVPNAVALANGNKLLTGKQKEEAKAAVKRVGADFGVKPSEAKGILLSDKFGNYITKESNGHYKVWRHTGTHVTLAGTVAFTGEEGLKRAKARLLTVGKESAGEQSATPPAPVEPVAPEPVAEKTEAELNAEAKKRLDAAEKAKLDTLRPKLEALIDQQQGREWQLKGDTLKKPGFNMLWTPEERAEVKKTFNDIGLAVYTPEGTSSILKLDSESARIFNTILNERDIKKREESKRAAEDKKASADEETLAAADQGALTWARQTFGADFANAYNAAGFADFLSGKVNKFEPGRVNRKWTDGLEKLGALNQETGAVDLEKVKAAYLAERGDAEISPDVIASETTASLDDRAPVTDLDSLVSQVNAMSRGETTGEEVLNAWNWFKGNHTAIKTQLAKLTMKQLEPFQGVRRPDNKNDAVRSALHSLITRFNPGMSYSIDPMGGNLTDKLIAAMDEKIGQWTDEMLAQRKTDRAEAIADDERARTNPKTKDEWENFVYRAGRKALTPEEVKEILKIKNTYARIAAVVAKGEKVITPEQLAEFDAIRGLDRKAAAERQQEVKAVVRGVNAGTESEIIETKHTQKGHDLFVVKLAERVEKDTYSMLNAAAKRLGGYYSSFRGAGAVPGFQFKTRAEAEQFQAITKGETVDRTEAVQEKREEKKNAAAQRMIAYADRLDESADEKLNQDRKTNTAKRAREAGYQEGEALKSKAMAQTMRNLAAAMQSGEATHLDNVSTGVQVEMLRELAIRAKQDAERAQGMSYSDTEKTKYEPPTVEQMDKAQYPYPFVDKSDILKMAELGSKTPGAKRLADAVAKIRLVTRPHNENGTLNNSEDIENFRELSKKLTEGGKTLWDRYSWKFQSYDRLQRMGIKDLPSLRAALREFTQFQGKQAKADPLKEMERALIGVNLPGFFPTPATVINKMMDAADVQPGMTVLEPSAGKGDIADKLKAAGAEVDTVEISSRLRDILEAKGHKVIANDIMDINPRGFTYGDTFRAPDGREGIMRGLGGMGSGRVRLVIDGNERNPSYENRADLVGVKKNGSSGYDRIVMNPPFENGQDIEHVMHAYDLLKPGGKLVAIMSEGPFFRSDKKATAFREWLDEHGTSEKLDAGSFKGVEAFRQTGTNTRMVVIEKPSTAVGAPGAAYNPRDQRAIEDFAASEAPGDKTIGDPRIANPGQTPEQRSFFDAAYWTYINNKGTLTDKEATRAGEEVAARWPNEVIRAVIDSAENGQPLDAVTTKAAIVMNRIMTNVMLTSGKESDRRAAREFTDAYIKTGSDISDAFRARRDQTATPAQRMQDFMSWALTEPVRFTVKLDAAEAPARAQMLKMIENMETELADAKTRTGSAERIKYLENELKTLKSKRTREQKIHEASEETVKFIKKELKRAGMTVEDLMGGRVAMRRKFSQIVVDAAANSDVTRAQAIEHIIHGWPTKKIVRATNYTESEVDALRDSIRTDPKVREQLFTYFKTGGKLEDLAATAISAPSAAAISDEEATALMEKALEMLIPSKKQVDNSQWKKVKREDKKSGKYAGMSTENATAQRTIDRLSATLAKTGEVAAEKPEVSALADLIAEHRTEGVEDFTDKVEAMGVTAERAATLDAVLTEMRNKTSEIKAMSHTPAGVMESAMKRIARNKGKVEWKSPRAKTAIERLLSQHLKKGVKDFEKKATAMGATPEQAKALDEMSRAERERVRLVEAAKLKALEQVKEFDLTDEYIPFDVNNPNQVRRIMDTIAPGASTASNIMKEVFYSSIFSSPVTHIASGLDQIAGMALDAMFARLPEAFAGSAIRAINTHITKQDVNPNLSSMTEFGAYLKPLKNTLKEAWANAYMAWNTEQDVFRNNYLDNTLEFDENAQGYIHRPAIRGQGKIVNWDKVGRGIRVPTRLLAAAETFFKTINAKMAVSAEAMRLGMAQKLEGQELENFIRDQMADHTSESWQKGAKHAMRLSMMDSTSIPATIMNMPFAKEATFRRWEQEAVKALQEGRKADAKLARGKIAFFRLWNDFFQIVVAPIRVVPANSLAYVFDHSPFKAFPMLARIASGAGFAVQGKGFGTGYSYGMSNNAEGNARFIKELAGTVFGSAFWGMLLASAAEGDDDDLDKWMVIVGNRQRRGEDPSDYEATVRKYGGVQVVRFNIGGNVTTIPYYRVSGAGILLTPMVNALRTVKENTKANRDWALPALWSVLGGLKQQGQDMPMFRGIGDMIKLGEDLTASNKNDDTISEDFRRIFERVTTSFIPFHGLTNRLIGAPDESMRDIKAAEKFDTPGPDFWTKRAVIGPFPGFAPEKLDAYGDPIKLGGNTVSRLLYPSAAVPKTPTAADVAIEAFNRRKMIAAGETLPAFKMLRQITKADAKFTARDMETPLEKKRREALGTSSYEKAVTPGADAKKDIPMTPEMTHGFKQLAGAIFKNDIESVSGTVIKKDGKMVHVKKLTIEQAKKGEPDDIENIDIIQREAIADAKSFLLQHKDDKNWREALREKLKQVRK